MKKIIIISQQVSSRGVDENEPTDTQNTPMPHIQNSPIVAVDFDWGGAPPGGGCFV